jgi:hypothetical protein
MPSQTLCQVVAYINPDLKKLIEKDIRKSGRRTSTSAYIESILKQHLEKKSA